MRQMLAIATVELARLLRSPTSFTLLLLVPVLQVVLFGTAIRPQNGHIRVAIAAPTAQAAADVAKRVRAEPGLDVVADDLRPGQAALAVAGDKAIIGIEIPQTRSFANPFAPNVPVRIVVDSTNVALTEGAIARIRAAYWHEAAVRSEIGVPDLQIDRLYNADARTDWAFLPALIGVTMMISMIMLGCLSLAREREGGTWETLLSLPVGRLEVLAGKALPYVVLGTMQGLFVLGIGVALFDLPVRGSLGALIALLPVFAAAHFLLGYAISARARTQIEALQGAVAFYLPAMLLSGFLYPFETLPVWAQRIGGVFPLTHMIRAARDALLKGRGSGDVLLDGLPIFAFMIAVAAVSLWMQPQQVD